MVSDGFLSYCFGGQVTDTFTATELGIPAPAATSARFSGMYAGMLRIEGDRIFRLVLAGSAISANQAVKQDITVATYSQVVPTAAVGDDTFGVCETAIASGSYGWCVINGPASCKILTAATAGQILAATTTAGVLGVPAAADVTIQRAKALENGAATNLAKKIYLF